MSKTGSGIRKLALCAGACVGLALAAPAAANPLVEAAEAGEAATALALVRDGADARATSPDGTTALHWAIYNGEADLVRALIDGGADVHAANQFGATPMSEAAVLGDVAILEMLLEAGADVDSPNADGQTALMVIARTENLAAARMLLEHGADPNAVETWRGQTPLMWAAAQSRPYMVKLLLDAGADPDAQSYVNDFPQVTAESRYIWRRISGWTPLLLAARQGCLDCARHLVEAGADIDKGNPENVSPLLTAVMNFHFDTGKYLVEQGANPDKWDWRGRNPLYAAVDLNTLPHGGRPDLPTDDATSALEMAEILLAAGANPNLQLKLIPGFRNIKDDRGADGQLTTGTTPLARAAKAFDTDAIALLAKYDARVDLANVNGLTPLMMAAGTGALSRDTRGHYDTPDVQDRSIATLQMLLDMGADVNAQQTDGSSAIFGAAGWGWTDVVAFLADQGARLELTDARGNTVLDHAEGRVSRGARTLTVAHPETAAKLRELMAEQGLEIPESVTEASNADADPA